MATTVVGAPYKVYINGGWNTYYLKTNTDAVVSSDGNSTLTELLAGKVNLNVLNTTDFKIVKDDNNVVTSIGVSQASFANEATTALTANKVAKSLSIQITDGDRVGDISIIYDGSEAGVLNLNSKHFDNENITIGGVTHRSLVIKEASTNQAGLMTADMVSKLNTVYNIVSVYEDSNNVIDKVQEIINVFAGYDEEFNLSETLTTLQEDLDNVETDSVKIGVTPTDGYSNVLSSTFFEKSTTGYINIKDNTVHAKTSATATTADKVANSHSFTIADSTSNYEGVVKGWTYNGSASVGVKLDSLCFKYNESNDVVQLQPSIFIQSTTPGVVREGTVWIQTS